VKPIHYIPFVGAAAVALLGLYLISGVRERVGNAAMQCVTETQLTPHALEEDGGRQLAECVRNARREGIGAWGALLLLAGAGALAATFGYLSGRSEQRGRDRPR
jgi:hypothetical protein